MAVKQRGWLKITVRVTAVVGLLAVAMLVFRWLDSTKPEPVKAKDGAALPRVEVLPAAEVPVQRQWHGYGTVKALDSANVPARVTATVVSIGKGIQEGMAVTEGQLLVRLDDSDYRRQAEIAKENLSELDSQLELLDVEQKSVAERLVLDTESVKLAEREAARVATTVARGAGMARDEDAARSALLTSRDKRLATLERLDRLAPQRRQLETRQKALQSSLQLAQQNLERCNIVSPLQGVLQAVDVEVGENVVPGQHVARVVDLRRVELPLQLPVSARVDVSAGNQVILEATNQTGLTWSAQLSRIAPEDDALTRTVTVFVEVEQTEAVARMMSVEDGAPPSVLTPGMFVAGTVTSDWRRQRWVVPHRAVRGGRVFLVADGTVRSRPVRIDFIFHGALPGLGLAEQQWAVLDTPPGAAALSAGDLVLINAGTSLLEGDSVTPVLQPTSPGVSRLATPQGAEEMTP